MSVSLSVYLAGLDLSVGNGDFLGSGGRLSGYHTAVSGEGTPTAAQSDSNTPWEGPYHRSTSMASSPQASCCLL